MIPTKIIIHHSATKDSGTVSWGAIRRYHIETMGWRDIGYHWGIELVNDQYEILLGRYPYEIGAHTIGENDCSVGISVVGNFDEDVPNESQIKKLYQLVSWLQLNFKIPDDQIFGHREFANKSCPGANLWKIVERMKQGGHYK